MVLNPFRKPEQARPIEPGEQAEPKPEHRIELAPLPERLRSAEQKTEVAQQAPAPVQPATPAPVPAAVVNKTEQQLRVESILEADLYDMYQQLDPATQQQFKAEGERVAGLVDQMLSQAKVNVGKIFDLILNWLKIIPGVSKLFLRQTAKIKTDTILQLKEPRS